MPCGALQTHFHERGCSGKRHLLSLAPCGSIAPAERTGSTPGRTPSQALCNASCSPSGTSCHLPRPGESFPKGEPFALSVKPFGFASSPKGRGGCDQREQTDEGQLWSDAALAERNLKIASPSSVAFATVIPHFVAIATSLPDRGESFPRGKPIISQIRKPYQWLPVLLL